MQKRFSKQSLGIGIATAIVIAIAPNMAALLGQVQLQSLQSGEVLQIPANTDVVFTCSDRNYLLFTPQEVTHVWWVYEYTGDETSNPSSFTGRLFAWDGQKNLVEDLNKTIISIREDSQYYVQSEVDMTFTCGGIFAVGSSGGSTSSVSAPVSSWPAPSSARYSDDEITDACSAVRTPGLPLGQYNESLQILGSSMQSMTAMECLVDFWASRAHNKNIVTTIKEAIEQYSHQSLSSKLTTLLSDSDSIIRANAAHLLLFYADSGSASALNNAANDLSPLVRYFARVAQHVRSGESISEAHRLSMTEVTAAQAAGIISYLYYEGIQNGELQALLYIENDARTRQEVVDAIQNIVPDVYRSSSPNQEQGSSTAITPVNPASSSQMTVGMTIAEACQILETQTPESSIEIAIRFLFSGPNLVNAEGCLADFATNAESSEDNLLILISLASQVENERMTLMLMDLMRHPNEAVRMAAVEALDGNNELQVTDAMIQAFQAEQDPAVRSILLRAIAKRPTADATAYFASLLENQTYAEHHLEIISLLGERYDDNAKSLLRSYLLERPAFPFTLKQAIIAVLAQKQSDAFATDLLVETALSGSDVNDFVRKSAVETLGARAPQAGVCDALVEKSLYDVNSTIRDAAIAQYLDYAADACRDQNDACGDRLIMTGDSALTELRFDDLRARLNADGNDTDAQHCMFAIIRFSSGSLQWAARAQAMFDLAEQQSPIVTDALAYVARNDSHDFNRRSALTHLADRIGEPVAREAVIYVKDNDPVQANRAYAQSILDDAGTQASSSSRMPSSSSRTSHSSSTSSQSSSSSIPTQPAQATLSLTKSVYAPATVQKGNYVQYLVVARNTSNNPAFNIQIREQIPEGVTVDLSHTSTNVCSVEGNEVVCTKETQLPPDYYWGLYIAYSIPVNDGSTECPDIVSSTNISTSTALTEDSQTTLVTTTPVECSQGAARPDLTLSMEPTPQSNLKQGGFAQFLLRTTNNGIVPAENVKISMSIPAGMELDTTHTSNVVCKPLEEPLDRMIECVRTGPLLAGQSWGVYLSINLTYNQGVACPVELIASARASTSTLESNAANNDAVSRPQIGCRDDGSNNKPVLETSMEPTALSSSEKGGFVQYAVRIKNTGTADAENVQAVLTVPATLGLRFNRDHSSPLGCSEQLRSPTDNTIICTVPRTLTPGEEWVVAMALSIEEEFGGESCTEAFTAQVVAETSSEVENTSRARAVHTQTVRCAGEDTGDETVEGLDLSISNTYYAANSQPVKLGYVMYLIRANNIGSIPASGVEIRAPIPAYMDFEPFVANTSPCTVEERELVCRYSGTVEPGRYWGVYARFKLNQPVYCVPSATLTARVLSTMGAEQNMENNQQTATASVNCLQSYPASLLGSVTQSLSGIALPVTALPSILQSVFAYVQAALLGM